MTGAMASGLALATQLQVLGQLTPRSGPVQVTNTVTPSSLIGNPINQAILEKGGLEGAGPKLSVAFQGILLLLALTACCCARWVCLHRRWLWLAKV